MTQKLRSPPETLNPIQALWKSVLLFYFGVVKKCDFCGIQQKILQNSDFAKKRDLIPVPNGEVAVDIEKMFAILFVKIIFCVEKQVFCENPIGRPQNLQHPTSKIGFHKKL
jgi:hypothetical protein